MLADAGAEDSAKLRLSARASSMSSMSSLSRAVDGDRALSRVDTRNGLCASVCMYACVCVYYVCIHNRVCHLSV